jgi:hypothetical protein
MNCTLDAKNGTAYLTSKIWNTLVASSCGTHGEVTMMEQISKSFTCYLEVRLMFLCPEF